MIQSETVHAYMHGGMVWLTLILNFLVFTKEMDMLPWFATFSISLLVGLEIGVLIGFLISVIFLLYYAARPGVTVQRGQVSISVFFC